MLWRNVQQPRPTLPPGARSHRARTPRRHYLDPPSVPRSVLSLRSLRREDSWRVEGVPGDNEFRGAEDIAQGSFDIPSKLYPGHLETRETLPQVAPLVPRSAPTLPALATLLMLSLNSSESC